MPELLNDKRRMWKYIVFGLLTFGIYCIIFNWKMVNDINTACGYVENDDQNRSPNYLLVVLFSVLTLGIYYYFWYYKQGNRIRNCGEDYGLRIDEKGGTYLLWALLGVFLFGIGPFIAEYLFIGNVNKICSAYNFKIKQAAAPQVPESPKSGGDIWPTYDPYNNTIPKKAVGHIICIKGTMRGADITLNSGEELRIGRSGEYAQLILPESDISRKHCSIRYQEQDQAFFITDYSTYGVVINESQKLTRNVTTEVPVGVTLTLGTGSNVFRLM